MTRRIALAVAEKAKIIAQGKKDAEAARPYNSLPEPSPSVSPGSGGGGGSVDGADRRDQSNVKQQNSR